MKVLVLATSFPRWRNDATAPFVLELCKGLADKDHEMVVLTPHYAGAVKKEKISGISVHRFSYFWPQRLQRLCYGGGILHNLKNSRWLWILVPFLFISLLFHTVKLARREHVDAIHSHWVIPAGFVGAICKKICRCSFLLTLHGSGDMLPAGKSYLRSVIRWTLNSSDICTANSEATACTIKEITGWGNDVTIIPMGVDLDLFYPNNAGFVSSVQNHFTELPIVLSVGRLINWKGIEYLIQAMAILKKRFPNVRLIICGDGPVRHELEELTGNLRLNENVLFKGNVPHEELPHHYKNAAVFVLPSILLENTGETEGLGVVLLEAMACGIPVVGSNVGGISEVIQDGWNGLLAQPKDTQDLAEKIERLLLENDLRQKFSENGFKTIEERFSWDAVTEKFDEVYNSLQPM